MKIVLKSRHVRFIALTAILLCLLVLALAACGGPASAPENAPSSGDLALLSQATAASQPTAAPAQPTSAPAGARAATRVARAAAAAPTQAPAANAPVIVMTATAPSPGSAQDLDRKIIKNAHLIAVVPNIDTAVFRFTGIASDVGGYVVSNRTFSDNDIHGATMVVAVPVDRFEEALNQIRQIPTEITQDFISSSDVTEQFVDLEARLKNLEATALRIRELLSRADTVEEALKINLELSEIESQIEQIKGKLNALSARTSFSTITLDLSEPFPTPTITPTPTPTATPTSIAWRPDETVSRAVQTQNNLLRGLGDTLIWLGIVILPYLILFAILVLLTRWFVVRIRRTNTPRP